MSQGSSQPSTPIKSSHTSSLSDIYKYLQLFLAHWFDTINYSNHPWLLLISRKEGNLIEVLWKTVLSQGKSMQSEMQLRKHLWLEKKGFVLRYWVAAQLPLLTFLHSGIKQKLYFKQVLVCTVWEGRYCYRGQFWADKITASLKPL